MKREAELRPTLWRTVRSVMNEQRLRLLKGVFAHDGEFCVRQIAKRSGMDDSIASIYLRQMNARGLLGVRRDRIKVFYNTEPDRSLPDAMAFQSALRTVLTGRLEKGWELRLMTILRGFSHFNRLAILLRLAEGPATYRELMESVGVCVKGFYHHLHFLLCADLVTTDFSTRERVFGLVRPKNPIADCLLRLLLADRYAAVSYYNPGSGRTTDRSEKVVLKRVRAETSGSSAKWKVKRTMKSRSRPMPRRIKSSLRDSDD